ncbi:hypothetical protein [Shewanella phage FishSpeaker]|nr:hypothetical protein [Shewanella phage FishSpeaker]
MGTFCVGTMRTSHGWETSSAEEAASLHITYWLASRHSQGRIYNKVPSFYYLWKEFGDNKDRLVEEVGNHLEEYFKELFEGVLVQCTAEFNEGSKSKYNLRIALRFTVDGNQYDLSKAVLVTKEYYRALDDARGTV